MYFMITLYFASLHLFPGYFQTHFSIKHGTALFKELSKTTVTPTSLVFKATFQNLKNSIYATLTNRVFNWLI